MKLNKNKFVIVGLSALLIQANLAISFGEGTLVEIMSKYNNLKVEEVYEMKKMIQKRSYLMK